MKRFILLKKSIFILLLSLLTLLITSCYGKTRIPKPEDGDLEFWITENVDNYDWTGHDEIYGWMGAREFLDKRYHSVLDEYGNMQVHPEYYVSYIITSYPDYLSKSKAVTRIVITDPSITIFGLSINSTAEEIEKKMSELGLKQLEETFRYKKGNVTISFLKDKIWIMAEVSNKAGIVF